MTDTNKALLPCPFCGCKSILCDSYIDFYQYYCRDCGAKAAYSKQSNGAISSWNTRALSPNAVVIPIDAIEKIKEAILNFDGWHQNRCRDGYYINTGLHRGAVEALAILSQYGEPNE